MSKLQLLVGPSSEPLGRKIEALTGVPTSYARGRSFPDGETCVRVELNEVPDTLFILQSTYPPQDLHLQQLYQMIEIAASYYGCRDIVCLVPYLAYARQDRRSITGEPISAKIVAHCLASLGARHLITVEVHSRRVFQTVPISFTNLSLGAAFADWLGKRDLPNPILVSPDAGGAERVLGIGRMLGWPAITLEKRKDRDGRTWYDENVPDVRGRAAVIIDDLCSSGSTLVPVARLLLDAGAHALLYGAAHFFADPEAVRQKIGAPIEFFSTDSVPNSAACVSLASTFADLIGSTHVRDSGGMYYENIAVNHVCGSPQPRA